MGQPSYILAQGFRFCSLQRGLIRVSIHHNSHPNTPSLSTTYQVPYLREDCPSHPDTGLAAHPSFRNWPTCVRIAHLTLTPALPRIALSGTGRLRLSTPFHSHVTMDINMFLKFTHSFIRSYQVSVRQIDFS